MNNFIRKLLSVIFKEGSRLAFRGDLSAKLIKAKKEKQK
jgi:hypothetical protein